eukprot:scaffold17307_cov63-Phaeocystis_antarctica.AAC.3
MRRAAWAGMVPYQGDHTADQADRPRVAPGPPPAPAAAPLRSSAALQSSPPPPPPQAIARCTTPPPRPWRSSPGALSCHRASPAPRRAWSCRDCGGSRRDSPPCSQPRVESASPPAPAAAPPRSSAAAPLQPSPPPPPAPPAFVRRTAPPPRSWRSYPGAWLGLAGVVEVHAEVARLVVGHEQRQPLRLRLLPRLLARQRRRHCSLLCLRLPLQRSRNAQRCLFGCGEAAQVHSLATAFHLRHIGPVLTGLVEGHAEIACLVVLGLEQRNPSAGLRARHREDGSRQRGATGG